jgi:hypothetical protein
MCPNVSTPKLAENDRRDGSYATAATAATAVDHLVTLSLVVEFEDAGSSGVTSQVGVAAFRSR